MPSPADQIMMEHDGGRGARPTPLAHPRLGLHLHPELVPGEGLYLLAEPEPLHFAEPIFGDLVPLLDGRRSIEAIFSALRGRHGPHEVYAALDRLRARGLLVEGPSAPVPERPAAAWWEALGVSGTQARERLSRAPVSVTALEEGRSGSPPRERSGSPASAPWVQALRALGIGVGEPGGPAGALDVVIAEDYLDPALATLDARARAEGRPWLLVRPFGVKPWLGPLFVPSRTGCWECLAQRLRGHRRLQTHLHRALGRPAEAPVTGSLPSTLAVVTNVVVTEVAKWLVLGRSALGGAVITLDLDTLERQAHALVRRPQCPACGQPASMDPRAPARPSLGEPFDGPVDPAPAAAASLGVPATSGRGGDWRTRSPEDTAARLHHHVSPITGIIGRVEPRLAQHADVTPLFVTDHSFADMDTERWFLREGFRKRSGGKGRTRAQALASALGESIERYCGVLQGDEPRLRATGKQLGPAAIDPNACMGFSARQYAERERWNAAGSKVRHVPEPFHDGLELEWTPLWSLTDDVPRYLPTEYCYYGYAYDHPEHGPVPRVAVADSNGCAAGNTLAEATLQGLLELVERDCVALWWYNRLRRPGVALESFEAPYVLELVEHYRSLERELWAIDITSDLGIPAFAAVSRRVDQAREDVIMGFGAHVDARVALVRALTEVGQSLPSVPSPGQDPRARYRGDNLEATRWWSTATIATEPYLRPDADLPRRTLADHPRPQAGPVAAQLHRCVERLAAHGLPTLVLDQSRPDVELAVARVVVPGLRHFWARFGPGRLYDVPVAQGWRSAPLPEAELNEHVIYF